MLSCHPTNYARAPSRSAIDIYGKFIEYSEFITIIIDRIVNDIYAFEKFTLLLQNTTKKDQKPEKELISNCLLAFSRMRLDFLDFFLHSRIFFNVLTRSIRQSFKHSQIKNYNLIPYSSTSLLKKIDVCKDNIDPDIFKEIEKHMKWIPQFTDDRDGLVHKYFHFTFTNTRNGKLGFDLLGNVRRTWGTDTVKPIIDELQRYVDKITNLLKFLAENLP